MVATSPTVMNSVTLIVFFSASFWAMSSSNFNLWESLFSLRYLAPFDDLPCNFSKVSLICFWTSSSLGSFETTLALEVLLKFFLFWLVGFTGSLLILILFLFEPEDCLLALGFGFSNFPKSILSPTVFKPLNFLYLVSIFVLSLGLSSELSWTGFFGSISFGKSSLGFDSDFGFGLFKLSKSILPKCTGFLISALSINEAFFFCFSSISFSILSLNSSFSFLFSSLKSWDSTLLDLSELNSFKNKSYCSDEIFVVGLASISWPFTDKNSTALSREILNSLSTLFNLVNLVSLIFKYNIIQKILHLIHFWPQ